MITSLVITIIGIVAVILLLVCVIFAALSILFMYTGRAATYDRAGKKMAKASKPKKAKKK